MRAAFYECDVTPPLGGFMWGHYMPMYAKTVHDRLYAKAVVVEDAGEYAAIVVVDTCAIPEDMHDIVTKRIYEFTGISPDRVCIASNHTHSGASVSGDNTVGCKADETYKDVFYRLCADAVTLAYQKLDEVDVKFGQSEVNGISFNRNFVLEDGSLVTHGRGRKNIVKPLGEIDPALPVLVFEKDGKPIGAVINFACHQCCLDALYMEAPGYSGDYASALSKKLKEYYGQDFVSLFVLGTCGDINHVNPDDSVPMKPLWYRQMGRILADGVVEAINSAEPVTGSVGVATEIIEIERRQIDKEGAREIGKHRLEVDYGLYRTRNLLYYEAVNTEKTSKLKVQAIRIGDVCISTLPGEVYVCYGKGIKENSPFKRQMIIENCNYYCGYIPSMEAFAEGSDIYEITLCFHSNLIPEAGRVLQDKAVELANKLA